MIVPPRYHKLYSDADDFSDAEGIDDTEQHIPKAPVERDRDYTEEKEQRERTRRELKRLKHKMKYTY